MISGYATLKNTKNYLDSKKVSFNTSDYFSCSKIAMGTHLGDFSDEDSNLYRNTLAFGLENGLNFIDTAVNYRGMRSEVDVGIVLQDLICNKKSI